MFLCNEMQDLLWRVCFIFDRERVETPHLYVLCKWTRNTLQLCIVLVVGLRPDPFISSLIWLFDDKTRTRKNKGSANIIGFTVSELPNVFSVLPSHFLNQRKILLSATPRVISPWFYLSSLISECRRLAWRSQLHIYYTFSHWGPQAWRLTRPDGRSGTNN